MDAIISWFFTFFGLLDLIALILVKIRRSLHPGRSKLTKLSLTVKTDDVIGIRREVDPHEQLRTVQG